MEWNLPSRDPGMVIPVLHEGFDDEDLSFVSASRFEDKYNQYSSDVLVLLRS
jgi:hypothetical protein